MSATHQTNCTSNSAHLYVAMEMVAQRCLQVALCSEKIITCDLQASDLNERSRICCPSVTIAARFAPCFGR